MIKNEILIALMLFEGIGNETIKKIIEEGGVDNEGSLCPENFDHIIKFQRDAELKKILQNNWSKNLDCARKKIKEIVHYGINILNFTETEYPKLLNLTKDKPGILFYKGEKEVFQSQDVLAVVGTRYPTEYGQKIAEEATNFFAEKKYVIVSGLAIGVDTIAHKTALSNGALTIAVLTDLLDILPSGNRKLSEKIVQNGGLLVSETLSNLEPIKQFHFIKRNRIQSGLALGTLAIEAKEAGGTVNTIKYTKNQERLIFDSVEYNNQTGYNSMDDMMRKMKNSIFI